MAVLKLCHLCLVATVGAQLGEESVLLQTLRFQHQPKKALEDVTPVSFFMKALQDCLGFVAGAENLCPVEVTDPSGNKFTDIHWIHEGTQTVAENTVLDCKATRFPDAPNQVMSAVCSKSSLTKAESLLQVKRTTSKGGFSYNGYFWNIPARPVMPGLVEESILLQTVRFQHHSKQGLEDVVLPVSFFMKALQDCFGFVVGVENLCPVEVTDQSGNKLTDIHWIHEGTQTVAENTELDCKATQLPGAPNQVMSAVCSESSLTKAESLLQVKRTTSKGGFSYNGYFWNIPARPLMLENR